jgi:hypothetical protein
MTTTRPSPAELRNWAKENGFDVAERGRVSATVLEAWMRAHDADNGSAPTATATAEPAPTTDIPAQPAEVPATPAPPAQVPAQVTRTDSSESESRANKTDTRLSELERRVQALETRLAQQATTSVAPKRRFLRRS